jgi:cellulose synthase/poly-beta-1,6-N-acetylglucosamine synthase-like glycosyltransferase
MGSLWAIAHSAAIQLPGTGQRLVDVWLPFGFLGVVSWTVWLGRRIQSARYRPHGGSFDAPVSVVAPAYREDPDILASAVRSWVDAGANEIIIVMPVEEAYNRERASALVHQLNAHIRVVPSVKTEKRNCLDLGIRSASHEIVVLSDSDTLWEPDLLREVLRPFADPKVGGVGTRQRVLDPYSSLWRRAADWLLDSRYLCYVPAMSRRGGVSCLSGRTAAYRRSVLLPVLPELVDEVFLGRRCIAGDDGRLTWLVLRSGWKCVHQHTALAWTMMPDTARAFLSQRVRWSRNSYRCYLTAIYKRWLFHQPMITRVSVLQSLLAPLSLCVGYGFTLFALIRGDLLVAGTWFAWVMVGRGLRAVDHLRHNPRNLMLVPFMTALILGGFTLIKAYTFLTMNKHAWITREADEAVAAGQAAATLEAGAMARWNHQSVPALQEAEV